MTIPTILIPPLDILICIVYAQQRARVDPQNIDIKLRIGMYMTLLYSLVRYHYHIKIVCYSTGQPYTQEVKITPASSFPIDMYVLMDLSLTMSDDLGTLQRISQKLGQFIVVLSLYFIF
jgi:hypothetical protein